MRTWPVLVALALAACALHSGPAAADSAPSVMKLSTATVNDAQQHWMETFVALVDKDTGGQIKGLKIRALASAFANEQISRLGASPVAMTLADVLPALQQGTIDGAVAQVAVFSTPQYYDVAKYITETNHNYIFSMAFLSKKWFDALPVTLQEVLRKDAAAASDETNPWEADFFDGQRKVWIEKGGELIELPPGEQASMMKSLSSVGEDLSKSKPELHAAYETLVAAVKRTAQ
jgi:TRAP-type transport system periplasmic protein